MVEQPRTNDDIHVHDVTWHRSGEEHCGTLSLTGHHLTFSYVPTPKTQDEDLSNERERRALSADTAPSSLASSSTLSQAFANAQAAATSDGASKSKKATTKQKVLWVPYPMINRCVLRPSHAQNRPVGSQTSEQRSDRAPDAEELFPPTYGTGYERPSTDSARLAPYSSPRRPASPVAGIGEVNFKDSVRPTAIRLRCRDFQMMAFHFHGFTAGKSPDETARQVFFALRARCCLENIESMLAFHYHPPPEEVAVTTPVYDARKEFARMGISEKATEGPGAAWRVTDINRDYSFSVTYPSLLAVPRAVSDNMLKYGGAFRSRSRIPTLAYLHFNGGSITRSSQPLVGVQGKRNPQDERLVSAIFSSHTPPSGSPEDSPVHLPSLTSPSTTTLESVASGSATHDLDVSGLQISHSDATHEQKDGDAIAEFPRKVYGSTRRNLIVDARPKINALANKATGGGIEDVSHYMSANDTPTERIFLNIQNIHVMRSSLEKIIDSMANSDYVRLAPDQDALRKSGWLGHIAGLLEGSALVARVVGLAGSHVLIHCSDGWDRTSQVSALAQLMLDPYYRTLDGFITLIQKDFLSFGHKFRDRNGIQGSEKWFEIENERIAPSRARDNIGSDAGSLNALGSKALTGARNWFEKNRGTLFRQQHSSPGSMADSNSRPSTPPPNPIIHSSPHPTGKEDKEHKTKEKEIAPIFHQFLDAVYQMQRQYPNAFEFNERFLLRLLYQTYSGQYGEFLFNCENERVTHPNVPSVWQHFLARKLQFVSTEYVAKPEEALLLPKRGGDQQVEVRWWSKLFGRREEEMNVPRALGPSDPPSFSTQRAGASMDDKVAYSTQRTNALPETNGTLKEAKSAPALSKMDDRLTSGVPNLGMQASTPDTLPSTPAPAQRPLLAQQLTDLDILAKYSGSSPPSVGALTSDSNEQHHQPADSVDEGDPLGVGHSTSSIQAGSSGVDFAAFASQNAFRDR